MKRGAFFATFVVLMVLSGMSWGHEPPGIVYYIGGISETNIPALEPSVMVSIPDTSGISGSQVVVPVEITDVTGLEVYGAEVILTYDGAVLDADSVYGGPVASDLAVTYNVNEEGITRVILAGGSVPLSGSGPLVYVVFNVIGEPGSSTMVQVADVWINEGDPMAVGIPGMFTVMAGLSGIVTDEGAALPIEGAVVQAWDSYPDGSVLVSDTTDGSGSYALSVDAGVYDVRAYAYTYVEVSGMLEGGMDFSSVYYPRVAEDVSAPAMDVHFGLEPVPEVTPTNEWVNFVGTSSTFLGFSLQIGDVVTGQDSAGVVCGRFVVQAIGEYGFMPVYRDYPGDPDEGADPGETITLRGNGYRAVCLGPDDPEWTENGDTRHVEFGVEMEQTVVIPLDEGWNLVSWHVDTVNDSAHVLLEDIMEHVIVVLGFEEGGLTYDPRWSDFSTLQTMDHLHGYWILTGAEDTLEVWGMPVDPQTPIYLEENWNLVSYLPEAQDSVAHALESVWDHVNVALGFDDGGLTYDPMWPDFSTLQIMRPGFGYWILMAAAEPLIYPETQVAADRLLAKEVGEAPPYGVRIRPTNEWMALYGDEATLDGTPLRIGSVLEVLDPDGVVCGVGKVWGEGRYGFSAVYRDDPRTGVDEGAEPGDMLRVRVDGALTEGMVQWTHLGDVQQLSRLVRSEAAVNVPSSYALSQNYPNPFNPETVIRYQIPRPGHVHLSIYNTMGQRVCTLVNERKSAGNYAVRWDGLDARGLQVADGLYFYRIETGDFCQTRKMALIK